MARASSREGESASAPRVLDGAELRRGWWWRGRLRRRRGRRSCPGYWERGVAGGGVAADDVVVEHGLELPVLGLGELGEVGAAVEALLFAGDGDEDDGGGELELGEDAGGFEGDGDAAGVVVGAGGGVVGVGVGRCCGSRSGR